MLADPSIHHRGVLPSCDHMGHFVCAISQHLPARTMPRIHRSCMLLLYRRFRQEVSLRVDVDGAYFEAAPSYRRDGTLVMIQEPTHEARIGSAHSCLARAFGYHSQ